MSHDLIPLKDLPKKLPKRNGKRISTVTIWRWRTRGLAGVHLECQYIGGVPYSSVESVQKFFDAVSAAKNAQLQSGVTPRESKPTRLNKAAHRKAKKLLKA